MSAEIPTTEPAELRVGDTWKWKREDLSDYPASEWTLKYYFKNSSSHIEITATANGNNFDVSVSATSTSGYSAGTYSWVAYAEKGTGASLERYEVDSGTIKILPAFATTTAYDNRSHVKKVLDALESMIEGRATNSDLDIVSKSINDRSLTKNPELLFKYRDIYAARYQAELAKENIKNNKPTGRRILAQL